LRFRAAGRHRVCGGISRSGRFCLLALSVLACLAGCSDDSSNKAERQASQVPDVLHESPAQARRDIEQVGATARFTFLGQEDKPCAGLPPDGRIIRQRPKAGAVIRDGEIVQVQTSCGPGGSDPACRPRALHLEAFEEGFNGGQYVIGFHLVHFRGPPCELETTAVAEVQSGPSGERLDEVANNPESREVHERLGVGETLLRSWFWVNWCAEPTPAKTEIALAGLSATERATTPECQQRGTPSALRSATHLQSVVPRPDYLSALRRSRPAWAGGD
jgi:hypothetical protein